MAYQQLHLSAQSGRLPALGSRGPYQAAGHTPSICSSHRSSAGEEHLVPPIPPSLTASKNGISFAQHKLKLEECARLHAELERAKEELVAAKQYIQGVVGESGEVLTEASRLHDVMKVLSGELHTTQKRAQMLELENKQLRGELNRAREDTELLTASRVVLERKKQELREAAAGGQRPRIAGGQLPGCCVADPFHQQFPRDADVNLPAQFSDLTSLEVDPLAPETKEPVSFFQPPYFTPSPESEEPGEIYVEDEEDVDIEEVVEIEFPIVPTKVSEALPSAASEPTPEGGECLQKEQEGAQAAVEGTLTKEQQFPEVETSEEPAAPPEPIMYKRKEKRMTKGKVKKWVKIKNPKPLVTHRPRDANNAVLLNYLTYSFHEACAPHVEALESMYRGDTTFIMVKPPVEVKQLEVYSQLLRTAPPSPVGLWSASHLHLLSLRCQDSTAGLTIVAEMLPRLPFLQQLEIFGVSSTEGMRQLTASLAVAQQVEYLSLPQLAVEDDALELLWALLRQRQQLETPHDDEACEEEVKACCGEGDAVPSAAEETPTPALLPDTRGLSGTSRSSATTAGAAAVPSVQLKPPPCNDPPSDSLDVAPPRRLEIPTLDLSHCTVKEPDTLKRICCPGVQVLFLSGLTNVVTDISLHAILQGACPTLHTLDISHCSRLTPHSTLYLNRHPHIEVLRCENCAGLKKLDLEYVQVLYSPLNFVHDLRMPQLRRLPVPVESTSVLRSFVAPQLAELTLHGMQIDRFTLETCLMFSAEELLEVSAQEKQQQLEQAIAAECEKQKQFRVDEEEKLNPPVASDEPIEVKALVAQDGATAEPPATEPLVKTPLLMMPDGLSGAEDAFSSEPRDIVQRLRRSVALPASRAAHPPQFALLSFVNCQFTVTDELYRLLEQQSALQRLVIHGCTGLDDALLPTLPPTIVELDLGLTSALSDRSVQQIAPCLPLLTRLNLKAIGSRVSDAGVRSLYGLSQLQSLNLLGLSPALVTASAVAGLASALPRLEVLYHETAVVANGGASQPGRPVPASGTGFLQIHRTDEENQWREEVRHAPLQLLRLRNSASLKLWLETALPKPSSLWGMTQARTAAAAAARAHTALLYTPCPPHSWMASRPLRPGDEPLVVHPMAELALRVLSCEKKTLASEGGSKGGTVLQDEGSETENGGVAAGGRDGRTTLPGNDSVTSSSDEEESPLSAGAAREDGSSARSGLHKPHAAADSTGADEAEMGPWGEEDPLVAHQEIARQHLQQLQEEE